MADKIQKQNWLDAILLLVNMTPVQLSKESGLDQSVISKLRHDLVRPTPETLSAIAKATDLPVELVFRKAGLLPESEEKIDDWALSVAARIQTLPAEARNFIENTIEYFYNLEKRQRK